jgi:hypothetical protein
MATARQIEANRLNSLKSTGPVTPEGKMAVRFNALRHGVRSASLLLPGESLQKYWELCDEIGNEWQPKGRSELFFAEQMVAAQWKLRRIENAEYWIYRTGDPDKQLTALDRLWQAQIRQERSFARALHELERLQAARDKRVLLEPGPDGQIVHEPRPPEPEVQYLDADDLEIGEDLPEPAITEPEPAAVEALPPAPEPPPSAPYTVRDVTRRRHTASPAMASDPVPRSTEDVASGVGDQLPAGL